MSNGKRRRVMIVLLALCLLLIVVIGVQLWYGLHAVDTVKYAAQIVEPEVSELCPGDMLRYRVHVSIKTTPATARVAETFCRTGIDGTCSINLAKTYWLPLLDYREIDAPHSRPIPKDPFFRPGGKYEFWHAATDTDANQTTGYRVVFRIKENCPK